VKGGEGAPVSGAGRRGGMEARASGWGGSAGTARHRACARVMGGRGRGRRWGRV
jgi:hypothetical protein